MKKWKIVIVAVLLIFAACLCVGILHRKEDMASNPPTEVFEREGILGQSGYSVTRNGDSYAMYRTVEICRGVYEMDADGLIRVVSDDGVDQWFFSKQDENFVELWRNRYRWYEDNGDYYELEMDILNKTCVLRSGIPEILLEYEQKEEAQVLLIKDLGFAYWFRDGVLCEVYENNSLVETPKDDPDAQQLRLIYTPGTELGLQRGDEVIVRFRVDGVTMRYTTYGEDVDLLNRTNYAQY